MKQIACIIPTFNGAEIIGKCIHSITSQTYNAKVITVDSSSIDDSAELARSLNAEVTTILASDFNHGGTRQKMVDKHSEYDIYIFLTQDAYLEDNTAIKKIIYYFNDGVVGAVCGRQLPHYDASLFAIHARNYNYPADSSIKELEDRKKLGLKVAFMSNSFAAYRASALKDIGGFPEHVIFAEDMYVAAKMLLKGWKIAYAGDACCRHSHNYSIKEEFGRYFDMGVFHAREPWIREKLGGASGEGLRYVISELSFLGIKNIHLWPASLLRNFFKLLAYKMGQKEKHIPKKIKKNIGMDKRYWDGKFADY